MFEVGKRYKFVTLIREDGGLQEASEYWRVAAIDGTLLHLDNSDDSKGDDSAANLLIKDSEGNVVLDMPASAARSEHSMVLNTASCFFHSATPVK